MTATHHPLDFSGTVLPATWHKSVSPGVRGAVKTGDAVRVHAAWVEHLATRRRPFPPEGRAADPRGPLGWALGEDVGDRETFELVSRLARLDVRKAAGSHDWQDEASRWLAGLATGAIEVPRAVEALAWTRALPRLVERLSGELWWGLVGQLVEAAAEAQRLAPTEAPLLHALAAGELALALAYCLPELTACRALLGPGRQSASASLIDLCDGMGLVHARNWPLALPLLASWTRMVAIGSQWKKAQLSGDALAQYEWAVNQTLRWMRPDGSQVLAEGPSGAWCPELIKAALELDEDEEDRSIAALVTPEGKKSKVDRLTRQALPEAAMHSEWSAAAVLRADWDRSHPALSILYAGQTVRSELVARRDVLWSGPWQFDVRRDGRAAAPASDWEEVCWVTDSDVDYLELEMELSEGLLLQRQMILAREDGFFLLADNVLGQEPAQIEYAGRLPLGPGVRFEPERETTEGFLVRGRRAALVMPLTLPEWRDDDCPDVLRETAGGLELRQVSSGGSLAAALFVDLEPDRFDRKRTWRRLTVAASLAVQPDHVAVGQRVKIGKEQWLFYRSLALPANRTVLGHNLATETLLARFDETGEVEPLIEVA